MKFLKGTVAYTHKGTPQEHCGICRHYLNSTTCRIVQGDINPDGWCKKFSKSFRKKS